MIISLVIASFPGAGGVARKELGNEASLVGNIEIIIDI